jgi:hypothetical protein
VVAKLNESDGTIALMRRYGIPLTRENYLLLAFAGNVPAELDPEVAEELVDAGISSILPDSDVEQ